MLRECIRLALRTRRLRDGGFIDMGARYAQAASRWKAAKGWFSAAPAKLARNSNGWNALGAGKTVPYCNCTEAHIS